MRAFAPGGVGQCPLSAGPVLPPGSRPRGSRFGDVTWARIVRGGLARIERRQIASRWARTARGGVDCVALGSHYASRARPRQLRPGSRSHRPGVGGVFRVAGAVQRLVVRQCRSHGRGTGAPWPAGAGGRASRVARTSLDPRDRRVTRENVCLGYVLAGYPTISASIRRSRGLGRDRTGWDGAGTGPGPVTTGSVVVVQEGGGVDPIGPATTSGRFPDQSRGGRGRRGPGPACVMRAQRDAIHPTSRRASPARRNPSALDPRDPTWHNASPGDITETTPPGAGLRHGVGDAAASGQADSPEAGLRRRCAGSRTASSTSPGRDAPRTTRPTRPLSAERIDMSIDPAAAEQEYDFFAQAANQVPQGPPRRRSRRLSAPVPVRFSPEVLQRIRERADADDRSVSSWIRRAVENELGRSA